MGRRRVCGVLKESEFKDAVKGSRMTIRSIEAVRRVVVLGAAPAAVARELGISRQAMHQLIRRVIDKSGIYRAPVTAEAPVGGREPCSMCNESRFNLCRYGLLACQAFVDFVRTGRMYDPTGCRPTAARWDQLFPSSEVAVLRREIRAKKRKKKSTTEASEKKLKAVIEKHRKRLEEIDTRKAA